MKVSALFDKVLPRVTTLDRTSGITFIEAVNKVADIFFKRLHQIGSSVVREEWSGLTVTTEMLYLPSDFRGFADKQWLTDDDDNKWELSPTPYEYQTGEGTEPPPYMDLVGPFKAKFTPPPSDDSGEYDDTYTLGGFYYSHPDELSMIDYLPWEELFDHEFEEGVLLAIAFGITDSAIVQRISDLVVHEESNRTVKPRRNKTWV